MTFVITSLTMGVTVLISRYLGEKREGEIGKVIGGAILFFAVMAVVMMVLLLAGAPESGGDWICSAVSFYLRNNLFYHLLYY